MQAAGWHDFVQFGEDGNVTAYRSYDWERILGLSHESHGGAGGVVDTHLNGTTLPGSLSGEDSGDRIAVNLTAGQTYTWSYRGTGDHGVSDPWLRLIGTDGVTVITEDDDGGLGRTSQITFTAPETATYYLQATSWYQVDPTAPDYQDDGDYAIYQWSPEAGHDAGSTIETAGSIQVGTNFAYLETAGDRDYYAIQLTAGQVYTFTYNGGIASEAVNAGESIGVLGLYNAAGGTAVGLRVSTAGETSITFAAETSGTYYLRAEAYSNFTGTAAQTGGYTIDVTARPLSEMDPLESLNWDRANNVPTKMVDGVPTVYVYFAPPGENFGEKEPDGVTPMATFGWSAAQQTAVMHALQTQYTPITGINYVVTTDVSQATFRMLTTSNLAYGARFYPQDPAYGTQQGIGTFNLRSGGFGTDPNSLLPGGYSYAVILHEFGHAHGVAHPHDTGGGSEIMLGVNNLGGGNYSLGLFDLNQGVYTVMSYNDGWETHPDGLRTYSAATRGAGWSESLGAFDIAVLQERYGRHDHNEGNDVYTIADVQSEASYLTIWDTAGNDTIAYNGARNAQIDLLAATLDYSPTGGGVLSFARGIWGGYTIANGVVIENATGGSGNDALLGNAANNVLTGNAGDDTLLGRDGNDQLLGGAGNDRAQGGDGLDVVNLGGGNDVFVAEIGTTRSALRTGTMSVDIITDFDAAGDDLIDLSALGAFTFRGTNANRNAGDLTYKTYDSVNGAERALGIDIDGNPGASNVSGPVTVVYGNTDGGPADFAIILLNTRNVDASDFIFAASTTTATQTSLATSAAAMMGSGSSAGVQMLNASIAHDYLL